MMQFCVILLIGIVSGFLSSAPMGPINLWLADLTLKNAPIRQRILPFLSGVIIVDVAFCLLAMWGYGELLQENGSLGLLNKASACFLIVIGSLNLRNLLTATRGGGPFTLPYFKDSWQASGWKDLGLGLFLCGLNPAFLLFWVYIVNQMVEHFALHLDFKAGMCMALGILLGDGLWFRFLIYLVSKGQLKFGRRVILKVRVGIAVAFIVTGILALY